MTYASRLYKIMVGIIIDINRDSHLERISTMMALLEQDAYLNTITTSPLPRVAVALAALGVFLLTL